MVPNGNIWDPGDNVLILYSGSQNKLFVFVCRCGYIGKNSLKNITKFDWHDFSTQIVPSRLYNFVLRLTVWGKKQSSNALRRCSSILPVLIFKARLLDSTYCRARSVWVCEYSMAEVEWCTFLSWIMWIKYRYVLLLLWPYILFYFKQGFCWLRSFTPDSFKLHAAAVYWVSIVSPPSGWISAERMLFD